MTAAKRTRRLREPLKFLQRGATEWATVFQCRGRVTYLRGGEAVVASRLKGENTSVIRVRASSRTGAVDTTNWKIEKRQSGELFEIKSKIPTECGRWLDFTCVSEGT